MERSKKKVQRTASSSDAMAVPQVFRMASAQFAHEAMSCFTIPPPG